MVSAHTPRSHPCFKMHVHTSAHRTEVRGKKRVVRDARKGLLDLDSRQAEDN